jgi:adenylate cyclase
MDPRRLYDELRRRKVIRAAGLYLVAGWIAIQVAATLVPLLDLPEALARGTALLVIFGFPVAVALAWAFDITRGGIVRTAEADAASSPQSSPQATDARSARRLHFRAAGYVGLGMIIALSSFGAYAYLGPPAARSSDAIDAVAVLPFVNTSGDPANEYFSDGITDELLDALARIDGLRVPARTSSFQFKGQTTDVRDVARRLNVGAVLEGTVRRAGGRVRITAQLVDARTGFQIWSESYDRELVDLLAVQDDIARSIVDALKVQLAPAAVRAAAARTADIDVGAHDHYLLGRYHFHRRGAESLHQAVRHFRAAIEADPDYAAAYAGLALTHAVLPIFDPAGAPVAAAIRDGRAAAQKALALDPSNAHAYAALGQIAQNFEWDFQTAEQHYSRAVAGAPNDVTVRQWRAEVFVVLGRSEAAREMEDVLVLDPLSPIALSVTALTHMLLTRDFARAAELFRRAETLEPDFPLVREFSPLIFAALRDWPETRMRLHRLAQTPADSAAYDAWVEAASAAAAGRAVDARTDRFARDAAARFGGVVSFGSIAEVVLLGPVDAAAALDMLDGMIDDPRFRQQITWIGRFWFFDPLHDDARLGRLAGRLGIAGYGAQ